jgi:hypothetical protein
MGEARGADPRAAARVRHHGQMSEPQAPEPASGLGSVHRKRRRAARAAGPPAPRDATLPLPESHSASAVEPVPAAAAAQLAPVATSANPPALARTKARHGARAAKSATDAPPHGMTQTPETATTVPPTAPSSAPANSPAKAPVKAAGRRGRPGARGRDDGGDGPWTDLTGSGPSKVGLSAALRARDVDRPTAQDMAEAERSVVIVRRDGADDRRGNGRADGGAQVQGRSSAAQQNAVRQNAAATGDAPPRRSRRKRPSGSGV